MLRITAVRVTTSSDSGQDCTAFINRLRKRLGIKVALPRQTFSISILDDFGLSHLAVCATNARFWVG